MKTKIISQKMLSAECWPVQIWGTETCRDCEYHGTKECGGKKIRATSKNVLGYNIPLPEYTSKHTQVH